MFTVQDYLEKIASLTTKEDTSKLAKPEPKLEPEFIFACCGKEECSGCEGNSTIIKNPKYSKKLIKSSDLKEDVHPKEHQIEAAKVTNNAKGGVLLYHTTGLGKGLSSIMGAEQENQPTLAFTPAALRNNYNKEINRFSTNPEKYDVRSYNAAATNDYEPKPTLVADEVQRLRNQGKSYQGVLNAASQANKRILLSGTPLVNRPGDLASIINILHGKQMFTQDEFEDKFTDLKVTKPLLGLSLFGKTKVDPVVKNENELKDLLKDKVHYVNDSRVVENTKPHVDVEDISVPMTPLQSTLTKAMEGRLPFWARWAIKHNLPPDKQQSNQLNAFMSGMRQVSLSPSGFDTRLSDYQAFKQSNKLQKAYSKLKSEIKKPGGKVMVYSNYIGSGLKPYAAALERARIPHVMFTGDMSDKEKQESVDAYNSGRVKTVLIGPAGSEGISLKGTSLAQILDPHFHTPRIDQSIARAVRLDSHLHLPIEDRNVKVDRYITEPQLSFFDKLLGRPPATSSDKYLYARSKEKEEQIAKFIKILKEVGTRNQQSAKVINPRLKSQTLASVGEEE